MVAFPNLIVFTLPNVTLTSSTSRILGLCTAFEY